MNLENIILSERNQPQKALPQMVAFIWNVQNSQIYRNKVDLSWSEVEKMEG